MGTIAQNLEQVRRHIPPSVQLVAVSKFHPEEAVREAYDAGQRVFGESRAQELVRKYEALPKDIEWHFIGHLQTNKVKYVVPCVSIIHSVDSERLLREIEKSAAEIGCRVSCLLEIHVAQEESKYGFSVDECRAMLSSLDRASLPHVCIRGVMGMATYTDDEVRCGRNLPGCDRRSTLFALNFLPAIRTSRFCRWECRAIIRSR